MTFGFRLTQNAARIHGLFLGSSLTGLLLLPGLSSCRKDTPHEATPGVEVRAEKVVSLPIGVEYGYPGYVEGEKRVTLSTKIMGQITSLPYREGARVTAGEILGTIQSADILAKRSQAEAARAEASAAFNNVSANFDRMDDLFRRKSATQKELDDVTMALEISRAKVKATEEMVKEVTDVLAYASIVAPFDGSIVARYSEQGNMASPGMPILEVEDARTLKAVVSVPESEIDLFRRGDPVAVRVEASGPETRMDGTIDDINNAGNPASHQFQVRVRLRPATGVSVRSGMYATVLLTKGVRSVIVVPESLVTRRGQLEGVYVLVNGADALLRWVRTGKHFAGGKVEILSGLIEGESIITAASGRISDGMRVRVSP